jgi:hypothetical protein
MLTRFGEHRALSAAVAGLLVAGATVGGLGASGAFDRPSIIVNEHSIGTLAKPTPVCGIPSLLTGPASAPMGATTIPAGTDSSFTASYDLAATTTYYLAPGVHLLGSGRFAQFQPDAHDTFIGAPGAVITGRSQNQSAFDSTALHVTVEYLTIQKFTGGDGQAVVNHSGGAYWTMAHDTVQDNGGAGIALGSHNVADHDCLTRNQEYGFLSFGTSRTLTLSTDEISFNDATHAYDHGKTKKTTCGCSGGGKFWASWDGTVDNDYVHTNGNVGLWFDTDDAGFTIDHDYISGNWAEGIIYEISYNAQMVRDVFADNAWGGGPPLGFPDSAVYLPESGGDSRVASIDKGELLVATDTFRTNWGGVVSYENGNRFCGDDFDTYCTRVTPSTYTYTTCKAHLSGSTASGFPDYFDNCQWKAQNVTVERNRFSYTPSVIPTCTEARDCGFNGLFGTPGTADRWTGQSNPYTGDGLIPKAVSVSQGNRFIDNSYEGPWRFYSPAQGPSTPTHDTVKLTWSRWRSGGRYLTGQPFTYPGQDAGSTSTSG